MKVPPQEPLPRVETDVSPDYLLSLVREVEIDLEDHEKAINANEYASGVVPPNTTMPPADYKYKFYYNPTDQNLYWSDGTAWHLVLSTGSGPGLPTPDPEYDTHRDVFTITGSPGLNTGSWGVVAFNSSLQDESGGYDTGTGIYTVPAGVVLLQISVGMQVTWGGNSEETSGIRIRRTGGISASPGTVASFPKGHSDSLQNVYMPSVPVTPGDQFQVEAFSTRGDNSVVSSEHTYLYFAALEEIQPQQGL